MTYNQVGNMRKRIHDFINAGITEEEAVRIQVFSNEYLWKVVDPRPYPDGQQLIVLDLQGIGLSDISGDVVAFMKK